MIEKNNKLSDNDDNNGWSSEIAKMVMSAQESIEFMVAVYSLHSKKFLFVNNSFARTLKKSLGNLEEDQLHQWYTYIKSNEVEKVKRTIEDFIEYPLEGQFLSMKYHLKFESKEIYILHDILLRKINGEFLTINYVLDITDRKRIEKLFDKSNTDKKEKVVVEKQLKKLSPRQKEVLQLISDGYNSKEIADLLSISNHTVISHRKNLIEKFEAKNTAHLIKKVWSSILSRF